MIFDNVIIAHKTIYAMRAKCTRRVGWLATKLDMFKAYDRVEWNYLEGLMAKMGFASWWIHLIMSCVRTVSYSMVLNGKHCGKIVPSRGLRQGDPLSPTYFYYVQKD